MSDNIQDYFDSLNLTEWKICGNLNGGGQAKTIEVRNIRSGEIGIFRTLKRKEPKDIDRFNRELAILLKYPHSNIVKILDYTKDTNHQWYISKKGTHFETYWDKKRKNYLLIYCLKKLYK